MLTTTTSAMAGEQCPPHVLCPATAATAAQPAVLFVFCYTLGEAACVAAGRRTLGALPCSDPAPLASCLWCRAQAEGECPTETTDVLHFFR